MTDEPTAGVTSSVHWAAVRAPAGTWVADADVWETLPDGRTIQIAVAGQGIPLGDAVRAGLVSLGPDNTVGPSQTKEQPYHPGATRTIRPPPPAEKPQPAGKPAGGKNRRRT